jgi:hypothetical protein
MLVQCPLSQFDSRISEKAILHGIQLGSDSAAWDITPASFCWPGQHVAQTCPPPSTPQRRGCVPTSHPVSPHPVSRGLHAVVIDGGRGCEMVSEGSGAAL